MISPETRAFIDSMSREELLEEINRKNRSRFQGDSYAYLKTCLELIDKQQEKNDQGRQLELTQEANRIAAEANQIARDANRTSLRAYRMSAFSVVVAIVAAIIALLS